MDSETPTPEAPESPREEPSSLLRADAAQANVATVTSTGKRQVFKDIRRQLQDADLASPGVQKLLLDELEQKEAECEILESYIDRFHVADKRAAVLEEKLKTQNAIEVFFAVGMTLGGAIVGLAPFFWDESGHGPIVLMIGAALVLGSSIGRIVKT